MIRYPNIIGKTDTQKLEQMRSYLHQLADELNYQLDRTGNLMSGYPSTTNEVATPDKQNDSISNFDDIKALIIKSADIVESYYHKIKILLDESGSYVATSDFGEYKKDTKTFVEANDEKIAALVKATETIDENLDGIEDRMSQAESSIIQTAEQIESKVSKDGVVSAINQSAEEVKIEAHRVALEGYATFESLSTPGQTEIDGANVKTGKISAELIDVENLSVQKLEAKNATGSGISLNSLGLRRTSVDLTSPLFQLNYDWLQTSGFLQETPYFDMFSTYFSADEMSAGITEGVHIGTEGIEFRSNISNFSDYPTHTYDHEVDFGIDRYGQVTGKLKVDTPTEYNHAVNKAYVDALIARIQALEEKLQ